MIRTVGVRRLVDVRFDFVVDISEEISRFDVNQHINVEDLMTGEGYTATVWAAAGICLLLPL